MSRRGRLSFAVAFAFVSFCSVSAQAHLVNTNVGEFYAGMVHPLTSLEHLLPTLALAVLASQCGKGVVRWALFVFPLALLAGTLAGSRLPASGVIHLANLVALVALGGLLALGVRATRLATSSNGHSHLPPGAGDSPVTWRALLTLGISGGIVPCPSALVLLLAAVSLNRAGFGIVLVLAFSVGLAAVLTVVGLLFVKGSRLLQRVPQAGRWTRVLPVASALVILVVGIALTAEAVLTAR